MNNGGPPRAAELSVRGAPPSPSLCGGCVHASMSAITRRHDSVQEMLVASPPLASRPSERVVRTGKHRAVKTGAVPETAERPRASRSEEARRLSRRCSELVHAATLREAELQSARLQACVQLDATASAAAAEERCAALSAQLGVACQQLQASKAACEQQAALASAQREALEAQAKQLHASAVEARERAAALTEQLEACRAQTGVVLQVLVAPPAPGARPRSGVAPAAARPTTADVQHTEALLAQALRLRRAEASEARCEACGRGMLQRDELQLQSPAGASHSALAAAFEALLDEVASALLEVPDPSPLLHAAAKAARVAAAEELDAALAAAAAEAAAERVDAVAAALDVAQHAAALAMQAALTACEAEAACALDEERRRHATQLAQLRRGPVT